MNIDGRKEIVNINRSTFRSWYAKIFAASVIGFVSTASLAQPGNVIPGRMDFVGGLSVPTLGGPLMAIMGILLALVAYRVLRRNGGGGRTAAIGALGAGVLLAALGGGKVVQDSIAGMTPVPLEIPPGFVAIPDGMQEYKNVNPFSIRITNIVPPMCAEPYKLKTNTTQPKFLPANPCEVGKVLPPDGMCSTDYYLMCPVPG